jgi:hypothetical protein
MNDIQLILQQFSFTGERSEASSFEELTKDILQMHHIAQTGAVKAINQAMTLRNWLIGCYIVEYEQKGKDRAEYGDRLLKRLEEKVNIRGLNETLFLIARRFYCYYPQIGDLLAPSKSATVSQKSNGVYGIPATPSQKSPKSPVVTPASHQNDEFRHSDLSQLNAYVSYFRDNEMNPGDNPPVGILLCTRRGEKMVEYALAGMDNHLFVSTYMLTLPDTKQLEEFLIKETDKLSL